MPTLPYRFNINSGVETRLTQCVKLPQFVICVGLQPSPSIGEGLGGGLGRLGLDAEATVKAFAFFGHFTQQVRGGEAFTTGFG